MASLNLDMFRWLKGAWEGKERGKGGEGKELQCRRKEKKRRGKIKWEKNERRRGRWEGGSSIRREMKGRGWRKGEGGTGMIK